jgi:hypothetical protein
MVSLLTSGQSVVAVITLLASYVSYLVIYRLFLSPLAALPGPRLAALTYWYECYFDVFQKAQYVFKIKELHKRHGMLTNSAPKS